MFREVSVCNQGDKSAGACAEATGKIANSALEAARKVRIRFIGMQGPYRNQTEM